MNKKAYYVYTRGAAFSLGAIAALVSGHLAKYGWTREALINKFFFLELTLAWLASFPFASYAALKKWEKDHREVP